MIKIDKEVKIYIACPPNVATGGPELLHQLAYKLKKRKINSYIFYCSQTGVQEENPVHINYKRYKTDYVLDIEDDEKNILIVPETMTDVLKRYTKSQKIIWWLSVNYYTGYGKKLKRILRIRIKDCFDVKNPEEHIVLHLVQSKYAEEYLRKYRIDNIKHLSDYLRKDFIDSSRLVNEEDKKNYVLYNPKKGFKFTSKLIEKYPHIQWKAIENLSPIEVKDLIIKSKVYIDFGNHPGKDRIPRECAVLKCCIITGRKGSAYYYEDVPIPDEFKFNSKSKELKSIYNKIVECLDNYEEEILKFEDYRDIILNQEYTFEKEIDSIFLKENHMNCD